MLKNSLFILFIALFFIACSDTEKEGEQKEESAVEISKDNTDVAEVNAEGFELMRQKCFICHFEKPDPSKKDIMIAPPMLRVQEHYKPAYQSKGEFVEAIKTWVNNPSESETLMPGAVRKFKLMPKLPFEEADLELIAAALYDIDFGEMPKMRMGKREGLKLNKGEKWNVSQAAMEQIATITEQLESFESDDITLYNQLGRDVFDNAKVLLLDDSYNDEMFDQLHTFFNGIEGNMHLLIAALDIEDAKEQQEALRLKFNTFSTYFE